MPFLPKRRRFTPRVEALEGRDAPAKLVIADTPVFSPVNDARESDAITPFDYGFSWDGHVEVAPPTGAAANSFHPGNFTWNGNLDLLVQAESGEVNGTPVTVTLSTGGTVAWDLDPKTSGGFTTSSIELSAGLNGAPTWFDLTGGQTNANNHSETSDSQSGTGFEIIPTTIGSVIRIVVTADGNSASWVKADGTTFRGKISADFGAGYYMPPDLTAGTITFNPSGGVDFSYAVNFQSIAADNLTPAAQLFWGDNNGPIGAAIYTESVPSAHGVYNRHLNAITPPPASATRLWLVVDGDQVIDEQDFNNNQSSAAFTNAVVFTGARFDGDSRPDVVGRFFSGISAPGQTYTVQLTPDLASFVTSSSQVVVRVGATALTATRSDPDPGWDHRTYITSAHDPGLLTRDTPVTVQAMLGTRVMASATEMIDVEPLPAWLMNVKPLTKSFDTNTQTYSFAGPLLNLSTGPRLGPPSIVPYGLSGANRVDVTASMQLSAALDPTRADLLTFAGSGRARGWYYGRQIFDVSGAFPSAGFFDASFPIDPRTLAFAQANVSFNLTGSQSLTDIFATPSYTKGYFRLTPHINASVNYTVAMTALLGPDGRLDAAGSGLNFNFQGALGGTLTPQLSLGSTLDGAIWKLNNVLGLPTSVTDPIRAQLRGTPGVPTVTLHGTATGELDAAGSVKFAGASLAPATSLVSWNGLLNLVPSISFVVTWPGGNFTDPNSTFLANYFAIHTTW